ncbi:MAG TPA: hypothetical protein VGX23_11520 [Actinocrinis sp.]|nr:hypothetical protein [Actinocrinis sp.]
MSADGDAQELLGAAEEVGRRTRRARQGYWFPLVVSGLLVAGACPFYVVDGDARLDPGFGMTITGVERSPIFQGGGPIFHGGWDASIYWLIGLTVGYGAVVLFYRLRARRIGVAGRIWPYAAVGMGLLGFLLLVGNARYVGVQVPGFVPADLFLMEGRGLFPLLVIAVGALVLAWSERSLPLGVFGLCYLAVALLANLYDIGNAFGFPWLRMGIYSDLPNLLAPAAVLLLGGVAFFLVQVRQGRRLRAGRA